MRAIDQTGCKTCGGKRLVYATKIRGGFRIRYFVCAQCDATSKTMQKFGSVYQMLPETVFPVADESVPLHVSPQKTD